MILLLFFILVVFSPNILYDSFFKGLIPEDLSQMDPLWVGFYGSLKPLVNLLMNSYVIPYSVRGASYFQYFELKSEKHRSYLRKQYLLLFITAIVIPVTTNDGDILSFFRYLSERTWQRVILRLGKNFLNSQDYFMRYMIQSAFISCTMAFMNVTWYLYNWVMRP